MTPIPASLVSLFGATSEIANRATSEMLRTGPIAPDFAEHQARFWERALRTMLKFRDSNHDGRFFDIDFADLRADPPAEMGRLYAWLDIDLAEEVSARMDAWWRNSSPSQRTLRRRLTRR